MSWAAAAARGAAPADPPPSSLVGPHETVAVLDANALIAAGGVSKYAQLADRLVTIKEVLAEVRDAASRAALAAATAAGAAEIGVLEPSSASLAEVTRFARETGELHSLSAVDLKVLALAHTLEVAAHGRGTHLRSAPAPPRLHSKAAAAAAGGRAALPGWGAAGGDWAELDALAEAEEAAAAAALAKAGGAVEDGGAGAADAQPAGPPSSSGRVVAAPAHDDSASSDADGSDGSWEVAAKSNAAARRRRRAAARRASRAERAAAEGSAGEPAAATVVQADDPPGSPTTPPPPPSRICCVTGDFAMQNVALQLGLRVVAPDGRAVDTARRWALRCSACGATSREAGRLFCPGCGHAALDKVEVLAGPDGSAVYGVRKRHTLRGTRFPLPAPKGGKEGRAANPVLAEDAMPGFGRRGGPARGGRGRKPSQARGDDDDDAVADADAWFARSGVAPAPAAAGGPGGAGGAGAVRKLRGAAAPLAGWRINPNERVHQRTNRRG